MVQWRVKNEDPYSPDRSAENDESARDRIPVPLTEIPHVRLVCNRSATRLKDRRDLPEAAHGVNVPVQVGEREVADCPILKPDHQAAALPIGHKLPDAAAGKIDLPFQFPGAVRATGFAPQLQGGASGLCETRRSHRVVAG